MQDKSDDQIKCIKAYRSQNVTIYTALLSEVAKEFHKRIPLSKIMGKDGIEYHDVFSGKDAVDCLVAILSINNRLEALDVGCALRNQNFFHDVNYELNLIDSPDELFAYKDLMDTLKEDDVSESTTIDDSSLLSSELPNGIYTELTVCYSPTCTSDNLCYSWSCPKKRSLKPSQSQSSAQINKEKNRLWVNSVPESIADTVLPEERKRQECIYELIYTEEDFVRDLQYCQDFWIEPLLNGDIISEEEKHAFVKTVFYNIVEIKQVNSELLKALNMRRSEKYLVSNIGDIMLEHVCRFHPFIEYGSHQIIGKFTFELEKKQNSVFANFVKETERKPESRRLELNGYLTKPTTRLGRYNLLLNEILKRTPDDNPDKILLPQVMKMITNYLQQVNSEAGKCENLFNLKQIGERLEFRSVADYVDLKLERPGRQLLMKGRMKRKENSSSESSDLQVFLFDHYLVIAKIKYINHLENYKTFRRPIPLELLSINTNITTTRQKRASSILPYNRATYLANVNNNAVPKPSSPENVSPSATKSPSTAIQFTHLGRKGAPPIILYASSNSIQQMWVKKINDQKSLLLEKKMAFSITPIVNEHFTTFNKINNTLTLPDNTCIEGKRILIGTDQGIYTTERDRETKKINVIKVVDIEKVTQMEIIPESQLLIMADKTIWTYPLDAFSPNLQLQAKKERIVGQNMSFIHVGECLSKTLACMVKSSTLSGTTIRVFERVLMDEHKKTKSLFNVKRLVRSGIPGLKTYKDLYFPSEATSIQLLKTQMCIISSREIGVVDMKSFGVQALLDPKDEALDFVFQRPDTRPISVFRVEFAKYLICYNEFAFCVDQRGRFIHSCARIDWESIPDSFAFSYPYVLAFEPDFIEIRNIDTGELEQVIQGKNIRCTSTQNQNINIQCVMDDPDLQGYQIIAQIEKLAGK